MVTDHHNTQRDLLAILFVIGTSAYIYRRFTICENEVSDISSDDKCGY